MIIRQKAVSVTPKCHNLFEDFNNGMSLRTSLIFVTCYLLYGRLHRYVFVLWTEQKFYTILQVPTQFVYNIKCSLLSGIFLLENVEVKKYTYRVTNSSTFAPFCLIILK